MRKHNTVPLALMPVMGVALFFSAHVSAAQFEPVTSLTCYNDGSCVTQGVSFIPLASNMACRIDGSSRGYTNIQPALRAGGVVNPVTGSAALIPVGFSGSAELGVVAEPNLQGGVRGGDTVTTVCDVTTQSGAKVSLSGERVLFPAYTRVAPPEPINWKITGGAPTTVHYSPEFRFADTSYGNGTGFTYNSMQTLSGNSGLCEQMVFNYNRQQIPTGNNTFELDGNLPMQFTLDNDTVRAKQGAYKCSATFIFDMN